MSPSASSDLLKTVLRNWEASSRSPALCCISLGQTCIQWTDGFNTQQDMSVSKLPSKGGRIRLGRLKGKLKFFYLNDKVVVCSVTWRIKYVFPPFLASADSFAQCIGRKQAWVLLRGFKMPALIVEPWQRLMWTSYHASIYSTYPKKVIHCTRKRKPEFE